jgi:hypothetical protein
LHSGKSEALGEFPFSRSVGKVSSLVVIEIREGRFVAGWGSRLGFSSCLVEMTTLVGSVPPTDDGAGAGAGAAAAWAGEKRRKTVAPPSPPLVLGSSSSNDESVFSAEDNINTEEALFYYKQLRERDGVLDIMRRTSTRMGDK